MTTVRGNGGAGRRGGALLTLLLLAMLVGATPRHAVALGLGNASVSSGLNEKLLAHVPLRGLSPGDLDDMKVGLASDEVFEREGLERSHVISRLRFKPVSAGAGPRIEITSRDHIREPSISFIIEARVRGRVVQRRYDLLLNLR